MAEAKKYSVGQVFKSTRFETDAFVISALVATGKPQTNAKGKPKSHRTFSYEVSYIPDVLVHVLPNGSDWINTRKPFMSSDEIIDKEISQGNWIMVDD